MMNLCTASSAFAFFLATLCTAPACAHVYRVGPTEEVTRISRIAELLEPGDTVLLTGDIEDSFILTSHGAFDKPITVRGRTEVRGGKIVRPRINVSGNAVTVAGHWNVLEGVEISPVSFTDRPRYAVKVSSDNVVLRNCKFSYNMEAVTSAIRSGNITIESCEFDSNGAPFPGFHSVDLFSCKPGSLATIQYCYFHDAVGGVFLKSHAPRTLVRYNWFEHSYYSALTVVEPESNLARTLPEEWQQELHPLHADIVGNVFVMGQSPGSRYSVLQMGGEDTTAPGTEGDFNIAHNLFLLSRGETSQSAVSILIHGNVDRVRVYGNVFLECGVPGGVLFERGNVWEGERTERFRKARGHGEPIIEGGCNWVSLRTKSIPDGLTKTLSGTRPMFEDLLNFRFRPCVGSPLVGAAVCPMPMGRMGDLTPEYEPTRGIPLDLQPVRRAKKTPPSIGPFEPLSE